MAWLDYLLDNGFLSPDKNSEPQTVEKGIFIPKWEPLAYLEKLSDSFVKGENLEQVDAVINIIRNVSQQPKDNYHTWYSFIKILKNIPNEKIPVSLLEFIPVWLDGRFDTMLQSSGIVEYLLPKFLENPSEDNVRKAEVILKHLFAIHKKNDANSLHAPGKSYYTRVHLYYLNQAFEQGDLKERIVRFVSPDILYILLDNTNFLIRDFAVSTRIADANKIYHVHAVPNKKNLQLIIRLGATDDSQIIYDNVVENYIEQDVGKIIERLESDLDRLSIADSDSRKEGIKYIRFGLTNDIHSIFSHTPIQDLDDDTSHDGELPHVFAFILRELFTQFSIQRPEAAKILFEAVIRQPQYSLPFFKRLILYSLATNWAELKPVFFEMIEKSDPEHYFSSYVYSHELHYLLRKIQLQLTTSECELIADILRAGPQTEKEYYPDPEIWRHRWLDALKENDYFKKDYTQISQQYNLEKRDYAEEGKVRVRVGTVSPYSVDDILSMDNEVLLKEILTFRNKDRFDDPSIDGFAECLMKAAEANPAKFTGNIEHYINVPYIYIYHIVVGLTTAWKNRISFDWETLLIFCIRYTRSDNFLQDKLEIRDDGVRAKKGWIAGAFGRLISEGTRSDDNAFDQNFLPMAKELLLGLTSSLQQEERTFEMDRTDYPMIVLNSTAGQVLRAVLDYSLRKARLQFPIESLEVKWENDVRNVFDSTFGKGIIDGYILIGMYFQQFYYLDKEWVEDKVLSYYNLEDKYWLAFVGGLGYTSPAWNKHVYSLLYQHYVRALTTTSSIDTHYNHGLIRHISAYYLWDYDTLSADSLIKILINTSEEKNVEELIQFFWQQEKYLNKYSLEEQHSLKSKAFVVWQMVLDRFKDTSPANEHIFESLVNLSDFLDRLDEHSVNLILHSIPYTKHYHTFNTILESLIRLKENKKQENMALYMARILGSLDFSSYLHDDQQNMVRDLVQFLFENEQQETAALLCNKFTIRGYDFLKELFYKYRQG